MCHLRAQHSTKYCTKFTELFTVQKVIIDSTWLFKLHSHLTCLSNQNYHVSCKFRGTQVAQQWEHSPLSIMFPSLIPDPASHVSWVCWSLSCASKVFLWLLWFSSLQKPNQIQSRLCSVARHESWRQPEAHLYAFNLAMLSCSPAIQPLGCKQDD